MTATDDTGVPAWLHTIEPLPDSVRISPLDHQGRFGVRRPTPPAEKASDVPTGRGTAFDVVFTPLDRDELVSWLLTGRVGTSEQLPAWGSVTADTPGHDMFAVDFSWESENRMEAVALLDTDGVPDAAACDLLALFTLTAAQARWLGLGWRYQAAGVPPDSAWQLIRAGIGPAEAARLPPGMAHGSHVQALAALRRVVADRPLPYAD